MSSGGGGYSLTSESGTTNSTPWKAQKPYIKDIFGLASGLATGTSYDWRPTVDATGAETGKEPQQISFFSGQNTAETTGYDPITWNEYMGLDLGSRKPPGSFSYYGLNSIPGAEKMGNFNGAGLWTPAGLFGKVDPYAPTQASFSPDQLNAQALARTRATTQNPAQAAGQGATSNIASGYYNASPYNISAPNIASANPLSTPTIGNVNYPNDANVWGNINKTLNGDYINANPYLDSMVTAATRPITRQYNDVLRPQLDTSAIAAGRYGSGAWADLQGNLAQDYLNAIGDTSANIYGQNYANERNLMNAAQGTGAGLTTNQAGLGLQRDTSQAQLAGDIGKYIYGQDLNRNIQQAQLGLQGQEANATTDISRLGQNIGSMLQAAGLAPQYANMDWQDIGSLAAVGQENQDYNQSLADYYTAMDQFQQLEPYTRLGILSDLLAGQYGGTVRSTGWAKSEQNTG